METPFPVRIAVDPFGTHLYRELPRDLGWDIRPGPAARYLLNVPSHGVTGKAFQLRLKAEDAWGNPLRELPAAPTITVVAGGVHRSLELAGGHDRGVWSYPVVLETAGVHRFEADGTLPSASNGITLVEAAERLPEHHHHWCDLHGQTGETVGVGTLGDYFSFARHYGFVDGCVHQGNDFQITGTPVGRPSNRFPSKLTSPAPSSPSRATSGRGPPPWAATTT